MPIGKHRRGRRLLANHDQADTDSSCPVRYTTTVPTQALGMMNGEFSNERAEAFAKRLAKDCGDDLAKQGDFASTVFH